LVSTVCPIPDAPTGKGDGEHDQAQNPEEAEPRTAGEKQTTVEHHPSEQRIRDTEHGGDENKRHDHGHPARVRGEQPENPAAKLGLCVPRIPSMTLASRVVPPAVRP